MKFRTYVKDWFKQQLDSHKNDKQWLMAVAEKMHIEDIEDLKDANPHNIYSAFFGYTNATEEEGSGLVDIDDFDFLVGIFNKNTEKLQMEYDFAGDFVNIIASHCIGYDYPKEFFSDLEYGGCASGLIGEFIYNSDCKEFYVKHIDSLEDYYKANRSELSIEESGDTPHYTYVVWLCFEEFAYHLANSLWPEYF